MDEATKLFDQMGLWEAGRPGNALEVFKSMCSYGQQPNVMTFSTILNGLCKQGNLDEALTLFKAMEKSRLKVNCVSYNILINGLLDEAYKVFRGMEECGCLPNGCCYNVIIQGFLRHKDIPEATLLIDEMVDKGFSADATTFELVIHLLRNDNLILTKLRNRSKCSKGKRVSYSVLWPPSFVQDLAVLLQGLWEARRPGIALEVFKNMCSHGQQPDKVTFSIILDGLCKQGYLDEALTLFKAMEKSRLKPDCVSFTILIDGSSSCASGASPCSTVQEQGTAFDFTYDNGTDWEFCLCRLNWLA
ncbi:hypothetical protein GH714_023424 [Hevea brasiliensis]|uniref:Pentacotripeptide-repeat region of PRORP domain-containing protein n=1 Tax=Hevea brasiliensis TaxID=3981 RepID=A0A6A6LCU7_HEVBR|nr:hypothetical protein GH714_023424 [Hevea brasiliensis]